MATYEHNGVFTYKDEQKNVHLMYPVTKKDNVEGMEVVDQEISDLRAFVGYMQEKIGVGVTSKTDDGATSMTEITGATTNLGNISGAVTNSNGFNVVSYRGEENLWGNIWTFVDGMNINAKGNPIG